MQTKITLVLLLMLLQVTIMNADNLQKGKVVDTRTTSFDEGWRFIKGNPSGAEAAAFDDSKWRTLDLPHDWSIEDLPNQIKDSIIGPFSKASIGKM